MRTIILQTTQSPGAVVMRTEAVRELKRALGAGVEIDVRTPCPALWEHNPHLTPLTDGAGELAQPRAQSGALDTPTSAGKLCFAGRAEE